MKINILFLLYRSKTNSNGKCPIRCRITYNKKRKEFSTGLFVPPVDWNTKQQELKPPDKDSINTQISLIKNKINQAFLFLQVNQINFNVDDIYSQYKMLNIQTWQEFTIFKKSTKMALKHFKKPLKKIHQVSQRNFTWWQPKKNITQITTQKSKYMKCLWRNIQKVLTCVLLKCA